MPSTPFNPEYKENYWAEHPVRSIEFEKSVRFSKSWPTSLDMWEHLAKNLDEKDLQRLSDYYQVSNPKDGIKGLLPEKLKSDMRDLVMYAVESIEAETTARLSQVLGVHQMDYNHEMFNRNKGVFKIPEWPLSCITSVAFVYPHALSTDHDKIFELPLPREWISVKRQKVNIIPTIGSLAYMGVHTGSFNGLPFGGIVGNYLYRPNMIRITYEAGFCHDRMPAFVWDTIMAKAEHKFLIDRGPTLSPWSSISTSIDGASQSTSVLTSQLIGTKKQELEKLYREGIRNLKRAFGRTITASYIGHK